MKYPSIVFFLVLSVSGFAQDAGIDYFGIDSTSKELVFFDDFEKENDNWLYKNGDPIIFNKNVFIESGAIHVKGYKKGFKAWASKVPFDYSRNFEIEFKAKVTGGEPNINCGIIFWSRESSESLVANYLYFKSRGYVELNTTDQVNDENSNDFTSATSIDGFQFNGYNTYTIRHYNNYYYIFVNKILVLNKPYRQTHGNLIGIGANKGSLVKYDYIKMSYL